MAEQDVSESSTPVQEPVWELDGYQVGNRDGYTLTLTGADTNSPYYVVVRDEDGVGIGAWHNDKVADEAIAADRKVAKDKPAPEPVELPAPVDDVQPTGSLKGLLSK